MLRGAAADVPALLSCFFTDKPCDLCLRSSGNHHFKKPALGMRARPAERTTARACSEPEQRPWSWLQVTQCVLRSPHPSSLEASRWKATHKEVTRRRSPTWRRWAVPDWCSVLLTSQRCRPKACLLALTSISVRRRTTVPSMSRAIASERLPGENAYVAESALPAPSVPHRRSGACSISTCPPGPHPANEAALVATCGRGRGAPRQAHCRLPAAAAGSIPARAAGQLFAAQRRFAGAVTRCSCHSASRPGVTGKLGAGQHAVEPEQPRLHRATPYLIVCRKVIRSHTHSRPASVPVCQTARSERTEYS